MRHVRVIAACAFIGAFSLSACGSDEATTRASDQGAAAAPTAGIRVVSPEAAAGTISDPPSDLVILDVRTAEEFGEGHIEGATMLDFYRDDFATVLAELDPTVPYVVYCRSGNRSGQTRALMDGLGFASVEDVDGGIVAWQAAGLPLTTD